MEKPKCFTATRIELYGLNLYSGSNESWSLKTKFLIGHLSPKFSNHLGINEIYQDPRQNFSLNISHNAIAGPLINTRYTPIFADYGFHDWFAKHLSKAWFHMDHYRQPTFSSITHYSYYQEVSRYSSWLHYGLHITLPRINYNSDDQFLVHFFGKPIAIFSRYQTDPKFSLSSSNRRPNWKVGRILKDMLRSYIIHYDNHEDKCPFLAEFSPAIKQAGKWHYLKPRLVKGVEFLWVCH